MSSDTQIFDKRIVAITGGSSGIGAAAATLFAAEGATVFILDLREPDGATLAAGSCQFLHTDVSSAASVEQAFADIDRIAGGLDVLVNNAGMQDYGTLETTSEEAWDRVFAVNLKGMFLCSREAIKHMRNRRAPAIVNVSSVQGFVCQRNVLAYSTSKSAIAGLTRSIAVDYAPWLRCVAVSPGAVDTPMLRRDIAAAGNAAQQDAIRKETAGIHVLDRIADAVEIAQFIVFLASEKASFATGQTYRVDGGIGIRIEGT